MTLPTLWTGGLCVLLLSCGVWTQQQQQECTGGKADITFVVDYSTSVGETNFNTYMLPAIASVIDGLGTISADSVRVALVGFSTNTYLEFTFTDYLDKASLIRAVRNLKYKAGSTATGEALYMVRRDIVPRVRPGVKHLVVVLTDGIMNIGRDMEPEAEALRRAGAEIFAVGVGEYLSEEDLLKIGGSQDRVIVLKDFKDLLLRTKEITKMTCKSLVQPKVPVRAGCTNGNKVDITFVLDYSSSVGEDNFNNFMLPAVASIVDGLGTISADSVRVAVVGFSSKTYLEFLFDKYSDKASVINAIRSLKYKMGSTATGNALNLVRTDVVPRVRQGVKHLIIVVTDGRMNTGVEMEPEANELRKTSAELYAVGVGDVDEPELLKIGGKKDRVILLQDFNELLKSTADIVRLTCNVIEVMPVPKQPPPPGEPAKLDCSGGKADITFVIDYSTSVGEGDFTNYMLPTVSSIIDGVGPISADSIRVAVVGFSTNTYLEFVFNDYLDKARLIQTVKNLKYKAGSTATGEALNMVRKDLVPRVRVGVKHLVVVLTDGVMNVGRDMEPEANELRKTGAEVFAVGVGAYMDKQELLKLGGGEDHVLLLKDFKELLIRANEITKLTCKPIATSKNETKESAAGNCTGGKTEFTFVLDVSGSVGSDEFEKNVKSAVTAIVSTLNIGPAADRVALVIYSSAATLVFNLDTLTVPAQVFNAIQRLQYTGGSTATGEALALVQQEIVPKARQGITHIVVVITDGLSNTGRPVAPAAFALKQTGAIIFSVGVGIAISKQELLEIASKPDNIVSVSNYAELREKAVSIAKVACKTAKKEETKLPANCKDRQDFYVTLVVDTSADQGSEHFKARMVNFVNSVVSTLTPLQNQVRFALVTYNGAVRVEFDFNTYGQNFADIVKHISALQLSSSKDRLLGRALQTVRTDVSSKVKSGATHVVALFTAGEPSLGDCFSETALLLVDSGAQLVVVTSHHQMEKRTMVDLTSLSSTVDKKMKAILSYGGRVDNSVRVNGLVSVVCALVPAK